jgi:hypothetical protein
MSRCPYPAKLAHTFAYYRPASKETRRMLLPQLPTQISLGVIEKINHHKNKGAEYKKE